MTRFQPDAGSAAALQRFVERSRRYSGAQLPLTFARSVSDDPPPLSRMIQGGRGGEVRLKLYLTTVLLAGSQNAHPEFGRHAIFDVSGPSWARILGLPEPNTKGARRVADAQSWLADNDFLEVERRPGAEPIVRLLSADGLGREWARPTSPYITVPIDLWRQQWLWTLSGSDLAVLIALLDLQGGRLGEAQWMDRAQRARYGLSPETWRRASGRLQDLGLIEVTRQPVSRDLETPRQRALYLTDPARLTTPAFS